MMHTIRQWISRALALAVFGPIAAGIAQGPVATDGSGAHTLLTVESIGTGLVALVLVGLLLALTGLIGNVLGGRRESLLCMSFVLGWVAWTSGRLGHVYLLSSDASTSITLAIEALLLSVFVILIAAMVSGGKDQDQVSSFAISHLKSAFKDSALLGAMGASLVTAGAIAWLFARTDLPGQSVGVGFLSGVASGIVGTLVSGSMHGKEKHTGTPFAPIMLGVMLCGVLAPLVGMAVPGSNKIGTLSLAGDLPGYLALSPAAWMLGALLGVPVGHGWVEQSHAQVTSQPASSAS